MTKNAKNDPAQSVHEHLRDYEALHRPSTSGVTVNTASDINQKERYGYSHATYSNTSNRLRAEVKCCRLVCTVRVERAFWPAKSPSDGDVQQHRLDDTQPLEGCKLMNRRSLKPKGDLLTRLGSCGRSH